MVGGLNYVGTTGIGFKIMEGIIVAFDSMARGAGGVAPGATGALHSYTYNKIYDISYTIICGMAGCLNTGEEWLNVTRKEWRNSVNGNEMLTVAQVADFVNRNLMGTDSQFAGTMSILIAGYTNEIAELWETSLFDNDPKDIAVVGSSKEVVLKFLQNNGYHYNMGKRVAADLARRAICMAALEDPGTGGDSIKVILITPDGVEFLSEDSFEDLRKIYFPDRQPLQEFMVEG